MHNCRLPACASPPHFPFLSPFLSPCLSLSLSLSLSLQKRSPKIVKSNTPWAPAPSSAPNLPSPVKFSW